jgi:hypothetical protein
VTVNLSCGSYATWVRSPRQVNRRHRARRHWPVRVTGGVGHDRRELHDPLGVKCAAEPIGERGHADWGELGIGGFTASITVR